ncbi:hypothetical protein K1719_007040 [Acacia pycnantha]|nr:hypothetical protein K1719_007040 [Acacia pycnantha]
MLSDQSPLPDFHRLSLSPYFFQTSIVSPSALIAAIIIRAASDHRELRVTDRRFDATDLHRALRCVGRRLDPVTGKIYHIKNFPPETEEIKSRLITRPDDTEEKVKSRLEIYKQNAEAVSSSNSIMPSFLYDILSP